MLNGSSCSQLRNHSPTHFTSTQLKTRLKQRCAAKRLFRWLLKMYVKPAPPFPLDMVFWLFP